MAVEEITIGGEQIKTLAELLRPRLKAVFVGLNPSPVSVECSHYYQGRHGKRFWRRLREYNLTPPLPPGQEDESAFEYGYGFADLVRRPSRASKDLTNAEKLAGVFDLADRLSRTSDHPLIIFTYAEPWNLAKAHLANKDYRILRMPGPYVAGKQVKEMMEELQLALGISDSPTDN